MTSIFKYNRPWVHNLTFKRKKSMKAPRLSFFIQFPYKSVSYKFSDDAQYIHIRWLSSYLPLPTRIMSISIQSYILHVYKNSEIGPESIEWASALERWRNITTDVDDGYVNCPSIHETNKRFSIVVHPKEGPSEALESVPNRWNALRLRPCVIITRYTAQNEYRSKTA